MNPFSLEIKLIILAVIAAVLIGSGIWFRGVLADNKEMAGKIKAQVEEVKALTEEVARMNKQDAVDYALFENVENQKRLFAAEVAKQANDLRKLRKDLNDATQSCFTVVLPSAYLGGLPEARDQIRP